ncbi:glycoside hydrolase family 28 protein [Bacteroides ilei]|uniref:glycoside hydrolase family 28 protein n=1 Tax=Bacteroides ilei TaxID=1907658 RepID=UPI000931CE3D|nr:glycoside hydrolase family 28 protein [Bacteroides ilei]
MITVSTMRQWILSVGIAAFIWGCPNNQTKAANPEKISDEIYEDLPFQMDKVQQPTFPDYTRSITEFGAVGDGLVLNTEAFDKAIKEVASKGGGTVVVPEGLWLTGPIVLQSNINLHLENNALVLFTADHTQYPIIKTSFEGLETRRCQSPVSATGAENIAITGKGVMDGNGDTWRPVKKGKMTAGQWKALLAKGGVVDEKAGIWYPSEGSLKGALACKDFNVPEGIETDEDWNSIRDWLRPVLLSFQKCKKVLLEGVTFKNSPSWCLHPLSCEDLTINKVIVSNPWYSQNGDALDIESCNRVLVLNSSFDAGDDGICLKSGKDADGRRRGEPCQNVIIRDNAVLHGHGGFVVGSEMSGGVKNIYVDNCTFLGTDVGLRFKSTRGRGGVVENIHINNINMINIPNEGLIFDLFYGGKAPGEEDTADANVTANIPPVTEETPCFKDIFIKNVKAKGVGRAIYFNGLPEMPIKNIYIENVTISDAKEGVILNQAEGATLKNVKVITTKNGNNLKMKNVKNVTVGGKTYKNIGDKAESYKF